MPKTNSKRIGNSFEREVSIALSKWVSNDEKIKVFERRASSGGGRYDKSGKSVTCGDIDARMEMGMPFINTFHVECKKCLTKSKQDYKTALNNFILNKKSFLDNILLKALDEAELHNAYIFLVVSKSHMPTWVISNLIIDHIPSTVICNTFSLVNFELLMKSSYSEFRDLYL